MPWDALLTDEEVQRAEAYYGSGRRIRRVAAKLLAGEPIQVGGGGVACRARAGRVAVPRQAQGGLPAVGWGPATGAGRSC